MRIPAITAVALSLFGMVGPAAAAPCPGNPSAMGTSRVLAIDPRQYPLIGTVQYQDTLPLEDKEVVLTFDDGPMPPYTTRILETLAHECVKANYFIVGRMARGYPELLRRIHAEGHVIGTHSENHPLAFEKMPLRAVQAEIDQGFASTRAALKNPDAVAPFFRIPGLLRAEQVEQYLRSRGMATWSADVVADDWKHITASEVVSRSLARLDARGKGILLLHDIQPATALALPHLLRELKRRGYKIVQVVPAVAPAPLVAGVQRQPAASAAVVTPTVVTKPQVREITAWPVPQVAPQAARTAPAAAAEPPVVVTQTPQPAVPAQPPAPGLSQEAAAALASPVPSPPPAAEAAPPPEPAAEPAGEPVPPPARMPVPILDAAQLPRQNPAATPEQSGSAQAPLARPLMPGFKPSHSDAPSEKVTELPADRQIADPWAMRAELKLAPR